MPAITSEQLDAMTKDETYESLKMVLAYTNMDSLVGAIQEIYEYEDRLELSERVSEQLPSEMDIDPDNDC